MKKIILFLLCPFIAGCFIHLNLKINLFPDGRVSRTVEYTTDSKAELAEQYLLPAPGTWRCDTTEKGNPIWHYTVEEKFPSYRKVVSAYIRKGKRPDHISSSRPEIKIRRYFLFTDYEYQEDFFDATDTLKAKEGFNRLRASYIESLMHRMQQDGFSDQEIIRAGTFLKYWWDDFFQAFWTGRELDGFESETLGRRLSTVLYDTSRMTSGEKKVVTERLEKVFRRVDDDVSQQADRLSDEWEANDIFGVYGIIPLAEYTFEVEVTLPGSIVGTNGTRLTSSARLASSRVRWQFQNRDFFAQRYSLYAKTRVINFLNCALVAIVIITGFAVVFFLRYRRKR